MSMHFNRLASTESYCTKVLSKSSTHVFAMGQKTTKRKGPVANVAFRIGNIDSPVLSKPFLSAKPAKPPETHRPSGMARSQNAQDIPRLRLVPWSPTTNSCKFLDLQFPFCDILQYVTTILWTEWFYLPFDDLLGLGIAGSLSTSL